MTKALSLLMFLPFLAGSGARTDRQNEQQPSFEKIIFHTSACYGFCSIYHLQVEADKSLYLFAETVYKTDKDISIQRDTTKTGYFTGTVNDSLFAHLEQELKTIGLDTLEFNGASCCDGSMITIIVYYNGKKKLLKSMFPPAKARKLIDILYAICGKSNLIKADRKFYIENENPIMN
jgi:hypothetical protein